MAETKKVMVTLSTITSPKTKDAAEKSKKQAFELSHANRILNLPGSRWKLADDKFKWNGKEIANATK